jgi:hypothetical protein
VIRIGVSFHDEPLAPVVVGPVTDAVVVVVRDHADLRQLQLIT